MPNIKSPRIEKRTESDNKRTINKLLNMHDLVINSYCEQIGVPREILETEIEKGDPSESKRISQMTIDLSKLTPKDFSALLGVTNTLMKRWYLVHRGYDNNARQAQEDAKAKTTKKEKRQAETGSLEDQIVEVGHYAPSVKALWDNLPEEDKEKKTV